MILPKAIDINKAKAEQRKIQIDEGIALAKRVDDLRKLKLDTERSFETWRIGTSQTIQKEIDELISKKNVLALEVSEAEKIKIELKKPLDQEWEKLKTAHNQLNDEKSKVELDKEELKKERQNIESEKQESIRFISSLRQQEKDIKKASLQAEELLERAKNEHRSAVEERDIAERVSEQKIKEAEELKRQYEVGLKTISIRERQNLDKEKDLQKRENALSRRIKNLQRLHNERI